MQERPRPPDEHLFTHGMWQHVLWGGLAMATATVFTQGWALRGDHAAWQTMTFTVLTLSQMGHVLAIRSERRSLFEQGWRSNVPLLGAVAATIALQMAAIYVPALNRLLRTSALSLSELALAVAVSVAVFALVEIEKCLVRRHGPHGDRGRSVPERTARATSTSTERT